MISITYVLQSAMLRAQKNSGPGAALMATMARALVAEQMERAEAVAHRLLPRLAEGDMLRTQAAMARRLLKREPADVIALRREIARAAIDAGRYPLS